MRLPGSWAESLLVPFAASWTEVYRHVAGQECGTGTVHIHPGPAGFAEVEIPETIGAASRRFYRLRIELSP